MKISLNRYIVISSFLFASQVSANDYTLAEVVNRDADGAAQFKIDYLSKHEPGLRKQSMTAAYSFATVYNRTPHDIRLEGLTSSKGKVTVFSRAFDFTEPRCHISTLAHKKIYDISDALTDFEFRGLTMDSNMIVLFMTKKEMLSHVLSHFSVSIESADEPPENTNFKTRLTRSRLDVPWLDRWDRTIASSDIKKSEISTWVNRLLDLPTDGIFVAKMKDPQSYRTPERARRPAQRRI